jgi:hypothetical protein
VRNSQWREVRPDLPTWSTTGLPPKGSRLAYTDKHGNETIMNVTTLANRGKRCFAFDDTICPNRSARGRQGHPIPRLRLSSPTLPDCKSWRQRRSRDLLPRLGRGTILPEGIAGLSRRSVKRGPDVTQHSLHPQRVRP